MRGARSGGATGRRRWPAALPLFVATVAATGCELAEVVLAEPEDLVVAEVLVQVRDDDITTRPRAFALLHRTGDSGSGVPGARVVIRREEGTVLLPEADARDCVWSAPPGYASTCYRASWEDEHRFRPGDALRVEIDLPGGRRLDGATRIPGDFRFTHFPPNLGGSKFCGVQPDTTMELRWRSSEGAWAYVTETAIQRIKKAMAERGIEMGQDYLHLMGLSVSAADTTIVFPAEFGLLERFDLDRDLLVALQAGLPPGGQARVSVSAVDRNYANWARGGNFNPSGLVRIPSLRGAGTGFFGAAVVRELGVYVPPHPEWGGGAPPPCL